MNTIFDKRLFLFFTGLCLVSASLRAEIRVGLSHVVVLGPRNRKISADHPGVMREIVERSLGEDCMCIFVQAAGGDINPLMMARGETRDKDFDVVQVRERLVNEGVVRLFTLQGRLKPTPQRHTFDTDSK